MRNIINQLLTFGIAICLLILITRCTITQVKPPLSGTNPSPTPVNSTPSGTPTPAPSAATGDSLKWNHPAWSQELIADFTKNLSVFETATDLTSFCPNYFSLTPGVKPLVFANLAVEIAYRESAFDPNNIYHEQSMGYDSIGLFQLSYSDGIGPGCTLYAAVDSLQDPINNIDCAVLEMAKLVKRDHLIASGGPENRIGLSRYWSTIWPTHFYNEIKAAARSTKGCT